MNARNQVAFLLVGTCMTLALIILRRLNAPSGAYYVVLPTIAILLSLVFSWAYSVADPWLVLFSIVSSAIGGVVSAYVFTTYL